MRVPRPTNRLIQSIVSVLILFLIVRHVGPSALSKIVKELGSGFLWMAIALIPLSFLVRAVRWSLIINNAGARKRIEGKNKTGGSNKTGGRIGLWRLYKLSLVGVALNFLLPAGTGDIARAYYGYRESGLKEEMFSSSLADKLMGLFSVFVMGVISSLLLRLYQYAGVALVALVVCGFFLFFPHHVPWKALNKLLQLMKVKDLSQERLKESFGMSSRVIVFTLLLSILAWGITYFQFYLLCLACSAQVDIVYVYVLAPLIVLARMFPFTFSGFGSQEVVTIFMLGQVGVEPAVAMTVSILFSVVFLVIPGAFGGVAIWFSRRA